MKKISVIIPFFNAEKTLSNAINSIIMQNNNEYLEIILVDDGSKDNSTKIAMEYEQKYENIKFIKIQNSGVSHARNVGLSIASSEYIMFLDADDTFDLNLFSWLKKVLTNDCDILIFDYVAEYYNKIYESAVETYDFEQLDSLYCQDVAIGIMKSQTRLNTVWAKVFSKKMIDENNIKFIENLKIGEDCLFSYISYQHANNIKYYPFSGYYYYQNENSSVHKFYPKMMDIDLQWQLEFRKILDTYSTNEKYYIYSNYSLAKGVINCCYLNIGHKDAEYKFTKKVSLLKELVQSKPYSECDYVIAKKYFKSYNRILIELIKKRMFNVVVIMFYIKNNKNKLKLLNK